MESIRYLVFVFIVTLFSMILHELAHGLVALWQGDQTAKLSGRLSLNPLRHIDPIMTIAVPLVLALMGGPIFGGAKPVPINVRNLKHREWSFAMVAAAGPLTNLLLALIFFLFGHYSGALYGAGALSDLCYVGVMTNLGFAVFNILPIPPLDGSRILYVFAPNAVQNLMIKMERYGTMFVFLFIFICGGLFSSYMMGAEKGILNLFFWMVGGESI